MSAAITATVIGVAGSAYLSSKNQKATQQSVDKASYAANMQAEIAREQWDRYKQVYAPLEDRLVGEAQDYAKPWRFDAEASLAAANVNQQYDLARDRLQRTPGLDPSSGAYTAALAGLEMNRAASSAGAQNLARKQVEDTAYARKHTAVGLGKGLDTAASSALGGLANYHAGQAQQQQQQNMQYAGALGRVAERAVSGLANSNWLGGGAAPQTANPGANYSSSWTPVSQPMGGDIYFGV